MAEFVPVKGYVAFLEEWNGERRIIVYDSLNAAVQAAQKYEPIQLYVKAESLVVQADYS